MKKAIIPAAVVLAVLLGALFIFYKPHQEAPQPQPAEQPAAPKATKAPPPVRFPIVEEQPPQEPPSEEIKEEQPTAPPEQKIADPAMRRLATLLAGQDQLIKLFYLDHFIERFVVTVDNLPRRSLTLRQMPLKPVPGAFKVQAGQDGMIIAPANAQRYSSYIKLLQFLDTQKLVALYRGLYPKFQKAYTDLGYPHGYFNDRLVDVIDHLLATPDVQKPIRVELFNNRYRFVDPDLETLSAGQKILLRIGNRNAEAIKNKLRELRTELVKDSLQ